jgi:hypothetical protein
VPDPGSPTGLLGAPSTLLALVVGMLVVGVAAGLAAPRLLRRFRGPS